MDALKENRGQAAVTDALYFLLIVTSISVFLFSFSNGYGNTVSAQIAQNYNSDFATDALKTILYSSTPRNPDSSIYGLSSEVEIDQLLAYVKEDYADKRYLTEKTMLILAQDINSIMAPLGDNFDYIFYLSVPRDQEDVRQKFIFIFFHKTNFENIGTGRFPNFVADDPPRTDLLCSIGENADFGTINNSLKDLIIRVGDTAQASAKITMVAEDGITFRPFETQADLVLWDATEVGSVPYFKSSEWCCIEAGIEPFDSSACR